MFARAAPGLANAANVNLRHSLACIDNGIQSWSKSIVACPGPGLCEHSVFVNPEQHLAYGETGLFYVAGNPVIGRASCEAKNHSAGSKVTPAGSPKLPKHIELVRPIKFIVRLAVRRVGNYRIHAAIR
jgi:hypothetical protein